MRILMLLRPSAGGMRRMADLLTQGFVARGIQCSLVELADVRRTHGRQLLDQFDIVHAHGYRSALEASRLCKRDLPWVWTAHNMFLPNAPIGQRLAASFVLKRAVRHAQAPIAVSNAVRHSLSRSGIPDKDIRVIYNGIPILAMDGLPRRDDARSRLSLPEAAPVVAAVGRLAPEKGFDLLPNVMEYIWASLPNTRLIIAGDGPLRATLIGRFQHCSRPAQVTLLGFSEHLSDVYRAADLLLVPSRTEGMGLAAVEAMAHERPVIASAVGGLPEVVADRRTGLLVPPDVPHRLAAAACRVLEDAALAAEMGTAGRHEAEARFRIDRVLDETKAVYQAALK